MFELLGLIFGGLWESISSIVMGLIQIVYGVLSGCVVFLPGILLILVLNIIYKVIKKSKKR